MLSPDAGSDQTSTATLPDGRVVNLHDLFSKSGVYNSSTLDPVWQVDWFALKRDLLCSDDLQHVARLNRYGFRSNWAIAFYDEGKRVRTYDCPTLLTSMNWDRCLPFSTWDWHTRWYDAFDLDAGHKTVLLSTARRRVYVLGQEIDLGRQEFYTIDLSSGALVIGDRSARGLFGHTALHSYRWWLCLSLRSDGFCKPSRHRTVVAGFLSHKMAWSNPSRWKAEHNPASSDLAK